LDITLNESPQDYTRQTISMLPRSLLGGTTAAWPLAVRAQQDERMRRIGVLLPAAPDGEEFQSWVGRSCRGSRNRAGSMDEYGRSLKDSVDQSRGAG
jgi:hypothetical protein